MVVLLAGVAIGQATSAAQIAGVCLVAAGVLLVRGLRRPSRSSGLLFALGIAACIASYTLIDKHGIRYAAPITYLELSMLPAAAVYAGDGARRQGQGAREDGASACRRSPPAWPRSAPMRSCSQRSSAPRLRRSRPVRETSVVIATALAAPLLQRARRGACGSPAPGSSPAASRCSPTERSSPPAHRFRPPAVARRARGRRAPATRPLHMPAAEPARASTSRPRSALQAPARRSPPPARL